MDRLGAIFNPRTRPDLLVIDLNAPMGLLPSACLTFDPDEAKEMLLALGEWIITNGHMESPIVIGYKDGITPPPTGEEAATDE